MKYRSFEDLPVWKDAIELAVGIFGLAAGACFKGHAGTRNQLENAVVSISNNIAEGFERGTTQELLTFIYISRGSAGEVRSMLSLLERLPEFDELRVEIPDLKSTALSVSRQLRGWADSLQNSDIRGQRYLTEKSRRLTKAAAEREEFLEELRRVREEHQSGSASGDKES
jgi:four helix bundle protein